jgi:hypothetical protein
MTYKGNEQEAEDVREMAVPAWELVKDTAVDCIEITTPHSQPVTSLRVG